MIILENVSEHVQKSVNLYNQAKKEFINNKGKIKK